MCVCARTHAKSCLTLLQPDGLELPGSSVHGILQARILEWFAISCSRGSSHPGIKPTSLVFPASAGGFFTTMPPQKLNLRPLGKCLSLHLHIGPLWSSQYCIFPSSWVWRNWNLSGGEWIIIRSKLIKKLCVCVYVCESVCVCVCVYIYIYIYI